MDRRGALIRDHEEKRQILRDQNRKIFHPPPIEGIDIGVTEGLEMLDPEIRIPTDEDFVLPPPLDSLLDKAKKAYKFLPKQGDIDRLIAKINKKVLRDTNLCVDLRDRKAAYLTSPHFRHIYLYLLQNRLPLGKGAAKWLDQNARNDLILDGLLFKILDDGEGNLDTVLRIPTSKVHILLNAYHSSIRHVKLIICNEQNIYQQALINSNKFSAFGSSWNPGTSMVFREGVVSTGH